MVNDPENVIENLPFSLDSVIGGRAKIGLVVLASDYTLEHEFRKVFTVPGVDYYQARIENSPAITPTTLAAMKEKIASTLRLILPGEPLDVVAYCCTSASMVLGEETIFNCIREVQPNAKCTTPATAAFAAFDQFKAKKIAVLTPYRDDVNRIVKKYIEQAGYEVSVFGSFNEENDPIVSQIDEQSITAALDTITRDRDIDMVFVSCTSVPFLESAAAIEQRLGIPVTSSNHAMAWHCMRLAGVAGPLANFGRLYSV